MGRGRRPLVSNSNDWQSVFYNSVGSYVQLINFELAKTIESEALSKHIRIAGGFAFKSSSYVSDGIPVIRISDFNDEKIILDNVKFYKESADLIKYELYPGDIVIALTGGTIAKLGIVQEGIGKLYLNQRVGKFEVLNPDEFEAEYVYWIARSVQSIIKGLAWGAAIPNVSPKDIEKLIFPIPDRKTQKGIISFLNDLKNNSLEEKSYFNSEIEEKIISTHQNQVDGSALSVELNHQLSLVKQLRQAFLREAMQGKLVPQDPNDEPASVLLEKIKAEKEQLIKEKKIKKEKPLSPISEDEIPFEIPENWVWCRLGELTSYGSSPKAEPKDITDDTWVLDLEDIEKDSSKLLSKVRFQERNSLSTKSKFEIGDVLYSKLRPYLDKVIVADEPGVCTTEILPLKTYARLNPFFLMFSLKRPDFLSYVNSVTKGMKMPRLGTKEGELALIPLAPLYEQQRIVTKLDDLMLICDDLEASIKESQQQNEALLQQVLREALEVKEFSLLI